jgi:hypothetical protein
VTSRSFAALALLSTAALLAGCDSVREEEEAAPPPPPAVPARGDLIATPTRTGSYSPSDLLSVLPVSGLGRDLLRLAFTPTCTVEVWQVRYHTVGGRDEATTASAALMVPKGTDVACAGPRPVVVYAHGTNTDREYDIGNLADQDNGEGLVLAAVFASQGYVVVAPNYAGYANSTLGYHPYLNASQQSKDTVDALTASRRAFTTASVTAGTKLYVTGYSQGGYVAMATHRALQAAGTAVTASAPMSGPYALAAFGDALFLGQVSNAAVTNFALLATSYQRSYGNLWSSPGEVFVAKYATGIDGLLPNVSGVGTLEQQGQLPKDALFSSTPPTPELASLTPPTQPSAFARVYARGFAADHLVTNPYRLAYLNDRQANPDGGFPTPTTGLPPSSPGHPLRQALKRNDLRDWTPTAPTLLCGGNGDPTVYWFNTQLMERYWASTPGVPVTVLDVDASSPAGDPYRDVRNGFAAAKAAVQLRGGTEAVLESYHAGLVAPFCLAAVKQFFDAR